MLRSSVRTRRIVAATVVAVLAMFTVLIPQGAATAATSFVRLGGDGSSFAAPAIDQWSTDVVKQGINIDYTADGSAAGRLNFIQNQADFAGTDIQFLTQGDPFGGGKESTGSLSYSYIPVVAGGTAFLYNLKVGGRTITDLRLTGETIAKIFTGQITNWSDKAITKDYGAKLPSQPITVVTRSDGSGASYQFTRYLAHEYPSIWNAFCAANNGPQSNCGPTEFYPNFQGSQQKNGSDQVANYVSASYGEGSIAYDEYAYAKSRSLPVVKLLNKAGYFSLPLDSNVAIALQAAKINEDPTSINFLIQNLDGVYGYSDPRTYPVSSYSYLIVPRDSRPGTDGPPPRFNNDKGKTLSTWLNYVLCSAQQSAGQLGYSPLPKNLVTGGFKQVLHIPGHGTVPDLNKLSGCHNPTYSDGVNHLVQDAKQPTPCDKIGSPLNCVVKNGKAKRNGQQIAGTGDSTTGNGGGNSSGGTNGSSGGSNNTSSGGAVSKSGNGTATKVDPLVGGQGSGASGAANANTIYSVPVSLTDRSDTKALFSVLTTLELLAALVVPAVLGIWLQRRRARR